MDDWKQLLYDNYISTGQAGSNISLQDGISISDYPYNARLIQQHLPKNKDIVIADLACGYGALLFCLKELGYSNIVGVDISTEQVALAHELGMTEVKHQEIKEFLLESKKLFDVIFLMDILEHLDRTELFDLLSQVRISLEKRGMLIIHVPNAEGIFGTRIRYGDLTHENCFTPRSIEQVLSAFGFQNIHCFEDKPVIHGAKSLVRHIAWEVLTIPSRLLLTVETGAANHILSQNMLVISHAP